LGLCVPEEDGLSIDWSMFTRPAPTIPPQLAPANPRAHRLFVESYARDPVRAEQALELLLVGNYEIDVHFAAIFRDLTYLQRAEDYHLLRHKVHTRRHRLPGLNRWKETWRVFCHDLKRRTSEIRFPKVAVDLGQAAQRDVPLVVTPIQAALPISAVVLVARVEWPWYAQETTPVQLQVLAFDRVVFTRSVSVEDGEVRFTLPPDQWITASQQLILRAHAAQPLPNVQVEAWLEAKLQR
jgi:hypothetical protein